MATAKIYPLREWKLSRGAEEGFWSQTYNYSKPMLSGILRITDLNEAISLSWRSVKDLVFDAPIDINDTIATIESFFIQNEIIRLSNLRDVEIANMDVVSTGEKQSMIEQAERQYNYALQQLDLEKKNFARQERLFRDSVITPADYDIYENTLKLAEINTQVAYDALVSLRTGEKDPVVNLSDQTIISYEKEIKRLENQKAQYTIVTPINGIVEL